MHEFKYGFEKKLSGTTFEQAKAKVAEGLKVEGFGILSEIDVSATLKKKLDVDMEPYLILGACNPSLANRAIGGEPHIGLLLPCNVVVRQSEGDVFVSVADPKAMFTLVDNSAVAPIAAEADASLRRFVEAL